MIFETHAHYDDDRFDADREELLEKVLPEAGIGYVVNIAADMDSVRATDELTRKYDYFYGALGVHPECVGGLTEENLDEIAEIAGKNPKICAIGEIGFDYSEGNPPKEVQEKWFRAQISLAERLGLPIVVHSRDAAADTWRVLNELYGKREGRDFGIVHCFSYAKEEAQKYVKLGFLIGIGGVVTFKNGRKLQEAARDLPLESIVLETDSPYLSPEPNRGKRNHSGNLQYVAEKIAQLKGITPEEVCERTKENALRLYRIKVREAGRA
ncbi:MAG: TatD family hydrolase [Lachnospiraceae bacterium]|nr:TatD family hydrolase [Lachnospiraceae bacterium]